MGEINNVVDDQEVVAEEVVETTQSEESLPETTAENATVASVDEEPTEEEKQEEETQSEESSLEKEDSQKKEVPFHENPKFKERVEEIETKYGKKAQMWDTLAKLSQNDPTFQLELTKKLEEAGELPKGTYELAKKKFDKPSKENEKPDEISEKINNLPEVQFARDLMRQKQEEKAAEDAKIEQTLRDFESKHTDIAASEKPAVIRARIATLAEGYRDDGMSYEESLEEAYKMLFKRDELIASAREKGEIEGKIKSDLKETVSTPTGSQISSNNSTRKLSREEREAMAVLGMDEEEYIKYKDSDGYVE